MFDKKVYKCYKGESVEECCNSRVEEAVAHRTYVIVFILSIVFLIISLTVRTSENAEFVGQVSFASTITSIVLSVIAIWMSITGERNTNEIKMKVSEAASSLNQTTNTSKELSQNLQIMLEEQNDKYNVLIEKMEKNLENSEGIKARITDIQGIFDNFNISENDNKSDIDTYALLENMLESIKVIKINTEAFAAIDHIMENRPIGIYDVMNFLESRGNSEKDSAFIVGLVYPCCKDRLKKATKEYEDIKRKYITQ